MTSIYVWQGKMEESAEYAAFFKTRRALIDRTIEATNSYPDWNSPEEKTRVLNRLNEARAIYQGMQ